ncbi:MAG TPA: hypothetical protein PLZ57_12160 [Pseudobdellovibrionaceae bacterium]|nr:hypothetical protein [Pseudobdellovibrionaceae bacterium]
MSSQPQNSLRRSLRRPSRFVGIFASLIALGGCSGGGGSNAPAGESPVQLSQDQRRALEAWKQLPLKSCEASEVLGESMPSMPEIPEFPDRGPDRGMDRERVRRATVGGLDVDRLLELNGGSTWMGSPTKGFAAIHGAEAYFEGEYRSSAETTIEINGQRQSVKVETTGSGFDCRVRINGQDVAHRRLAKLVQIGAAWSSTPKLGGSAELRFKPRVLQLPSGSIEVELQSLVSALQSRLQDAEALQQAVQGLGYTEQIAQSHFAFVSSGVLNLSFDRLDAHPIGPQDAWLRMNESLDKLAAAGRGQEHPVTLILRAGRGQIADLQLSGGGAGNTQVLRAQFALLIELIGTHATEPELKIRVADASTGGAATPQGLVLENGIPARVDRCLSQRFEGLFRRAHANYLAGVARDLIPQLEAILANCDVEEPTVLDRIRQDGLLLGLLLRSIGVKDPQSLGRPGLNADLGSWRSIMVGYMQQALQNPSMRFDTTGQSPALRQLDLYVKEVRAQDHSKWSAKLRDDVLQAALHLALLGAPAHERTRLLSTLLQAVNGRERFAEALSLAMDEMLRSQGQSIQQLERARALDPRVQQMAEEAAAIAEGLRYRPYFAEVHETFFARDRQLAEIRSWRDRLLAAETAIAQHQSLKSRPELAARLILDSRSQLRAEDRVVAMAELARVLEAWPEVAEAFADQLYRQSPELTASRAWVATLQTSAGAALQAEVQGLREDVARSPLQAFNSSGLNSWLNQYLSEALLRRPQVVEIKAVRERVQLAAEFVGADQARAQSSSRDHFWQSTARDLMRRALSEAWTREMFEGLSHYAEIASERVNCQAQQSISARLNCGNLLSALSTAQGKLYEPRYVSLGLELARKLKSWLLRLGPSELSLRMTLIDAASPSFSPTWSKCSSSEFQLRLQAGEQMLNEIVSMSASAARLRRIQDLQSHLRSNCP